MDMRSATLFMTLPRWVGIYAIAEIAGWKLSEYGTDLARSGGGYHSPW